MTIPTPATPELRLSPDGKRIAVRLFPTRLFQWAWRDISGPLAGGCMPGRIADDWARLVPAPAAADRDAAIELLRDAVGAELDEPCSLDHNQNCQAHSWFAWGEQPCHVARAKEFLARFPEDDAAAPAVPAADDQEQRHDVARAIRDAYERLPDGTAPEFTEVHEWYAEADAAIAALREVPRA